MKEGMTTKSGKLFRYFNIAFDITILLTCVALAIYAKVSGDPKVDFGPALVMIGVCIVPFLFEVIFNRKLPNSVFLIFSVYIIFAGLVGSVLNLYDVYWYDRVIHFSMGYVIALLGFFFICQSGQNKKMHFLAVAFFCLFFSLFIEAIWEIFEWTLSIVMPSTHMQGAFVEGYSAPLVTDTMEDICCNLGGATLFFLHFIISKFTKKNLLITSMEKSFSYSEKLYNRGKKKIEKRKDLSQNDENGQETTIPSEKE